MTQGRYRNPTTGGTELSMTAVSESKYSTNVTMKSVPEGAVFLDPSSNICKKTTVSMTRCNSKFI